MLVGALILYFSDLDADIERILLHHWLAFVRSRHSRDNRVSVLWVFASLASL